MQKRYISLLALLMISAAAFAQNFTYEGVIDFSIAAQNGPSDLACDANGGLYAVTFNAGNSKLIYIPDPLNDPATRTVVTPSEAAGFPSGRGLTGVDVDSAGNVYISGDTGSPVSYVRQFSAAPALTESGSFIPTPNERLTSCQLYDDAHLMVLSFSGIRFYDTSNATQIGGLFVDSASSFQRSIARNSSNNDLYTYRNTSGSGTPGSVTLWSGGAPPSNLNLYTRISTLFIENLQLGTSTTAVGGLHYEDEFGLLFVQNHENSRLNVYEIEGTGAGATATFKTSLNGSESGTPTSSLLACDTHDYVDGKRLFIADLSNNRVLIYKVTVPNSADVQWELYQ